MGDERIAPSILNLGTIWRGPHSDLFPTDIDWMGGRVSTSADRGAVENPLPLPRIELRLLGLPTFTLVTILTQGHAVT
jgi:hypothetical protein